MTDDADKDWLREEKPFIAWFMDLVWRMFVVLAIVASLGVILAATGAIAAPRSRAVIVMLPNSMTPADGGECSRALPKRPNIGRPHFTINKQDRSNEPYHHRICYWRGTPA